MRSNNTDIFLVYTRVCQLLLLLDCNKLLSASIFSVVRFNWFNKLAAAKYSKFECVLMFFDFFMDMNITPQVILQNTCIYWGRGVFVCHQFEFLKRYLVYLGRNFSKH